MAKRVIDTDKFSNLLRDRILKYEEQKILVANLYGSKQEEDLTLPPNCLGLGRIKHFRRINNPDWLIDPLPIEPARKALGAGDKNLLRAQVFQIAGCNWRCWYCFVDYSLLSADPKHGKWITTDELVELFMKEPNRPNVIDLTGGQPDLVPEWVLWFMKSLIKVGLDKTTYLWSDDNLSSDYIWKFLSEEDLHFMCSYPHYGRVGCFKGFNEKSFTFNTTASPNLFERQFALMGKLLLLGLDVYAYATFTSPDRNNIKTDMKKFVDKMQELDPNLPLRTIPLEIKEFNANSVRIGKLYLEAIKNQYYAVDFWKEELINRYSTDELNLEITDVPLIKE